MRRYIIALCIVVSAVSATPGRAAIKLTTPEVKPEVRATTAQIMEIRLRFYSDGVHMLSNTGTDGAVTSCAEGYVEWRTGQGEGDQFQTVEAGKFVKLDAAQLAAIIYASRTAKPAEQLVPAMGETPVDRLFQAIVEWLKANGKL